jgi:GMP synthase (glutamine-hydrolysing)
VIPRATRHDPQLGHFDHQILRGTINRIVNEVRGITRVVPDVNSKAPAAIGWE